MALSGQILTTCSGNSGSKYNIWVVWNVTSQSPIYNNSNIKVTLYLQRNDGYANSAYNLNASNPVKLYIGGALKVDTAMAIDTRNNAVVTLATWSGAVSHNADGSLGLAIDGKFTLNGLTSLTGGEAAGTAWIDQLDRAAPSVGISVSDVGTDSATIHGSANVNCNLWEYTMDGGALWITFSGYNTTEASTTLSGFNPNETYTFQVRARKSSNYMYGYSGAAQASTIGKSTLNSVSDFAADAATVTVSCSITGASSSFSHDLSVMDGATPIFTITAFFANHGTESRTFTLTKDQRNTLLQYMANRKSLAANICLSTYTEDRSAQIGTSYASANITTSEEVSRPSFGIPTYNDYNATTAAITGNDQVLIQGFSKIHVVCPTATPKNGATIKSYSAAFGGVSVSGVGTTLYIDNINTAGDLTLVVTATDSRGYSQSYGKAVKVLPYTRPEIPDIAVNVRRQNSIGTNIILQFAGSVCSLPVNGTEKNAVAEIAYKLKKTSDADYGASTSLQTESSINGLTFSYSSDAAFTLDAESSYNLEITVNDALVPYTKDLIIPKGTPDISIRKGMVGVHNANPTAPLDVGGAIKASGFYNGFVRMLNGDDVNNLKDGGIYGYFVLPGEYYDSDNLPTNDSGILEVIPSGGATIPLFVVMQRFTSLPGAIYQRLCLYPDDWSAWTVVATKEGDISNDLYQHTSNKSNPHEVTKDQVGLGSVDNTSDASKPVSAAQQAAINAAAASGDKHYTHEQTVSSATWVCPHSLGKRPSVVVTDSAGTQIIGRADYPDLNTTVLTFKAPFTGKADFN